MAEAALVAWLRDQAHLSEPVLGETVSKLEANDAFNLLDIQQLRELPAWANLLPLITTQKNSAALDGVPLRAQRGETPSSADSNTTPLGTRRGDAIFSPSQYL